ncbi:type IV secretion system DNA-binding domain-containing protein (plasmid) [Pseudoduganella sp. UC29_106]|uniref:type IV secretion system DNA-binding domain-containing protein n=1 Tax=Pseudoduganella sp. UC29_106 TaxID=3374553 RepID=UPI003756B903
MTENFKAKAYRFLQHVLEWSDPTWWIILSCVLFLLCVIHFYPLELDEKDNHKLTDRLLVKLRFASLLLLGLGGVVAPISVYLFFGAIAGDDRLRVSNLFKEWAWDAFKIYWTLPVAAIIAGVTVNFCWHRYGEPYLSNLKRRFRVNQHVDQASDVREEHSKYEPKEFDPEKYFKDGFYFIGLDEQNQPIYVERNAFEETHMAFIGPTGFGKGVEAGVILTQSIRFGNCTAYVDPKEDKRIPYILQNEAKRAGVPFVYLDLNPDGKGNWDPFRGGSIRDRRARMISAYKLEASGTNADVYKAKERSIIDQVLERTDGTIKAMLEGVQAILGDADLSSLRDGLKEWAQISTFTANPKKVKGHSIEQSIMNNAVIYVKGSLTDGVVQRATRTYISEILQEAKRLVNQRTSQITLMVDETRFLISKEIADGLATSREMRTNMILATQALTDFLNIEDQTINAQALENSVKVNCQVKLIYRAADEYTAEWAEKMTGTKWITQARNEKVKVNRLGGETWDDTRAIDRVEVPFLSANVFLQLQQRVGVLFQPKALPKVMFSSWLTVDQSVCSWEKREKEADSDAKTDSVHSAATSTPRADLAGLSAEAAGSQTSERPRMRSNPKLSATQQADNRQSNAEV